MEYYYICNVGTTSFELKIHHQVNKKINKSRLSPFIYIFIYEC
jgi:hypothetical protein